MSERNEGWGSVSNARDAHFFRSGRSLCGRWMVLAKPMWEARQELGETPENGTCKTCWKKRAREEGKTPNASLSGVSAAGETK